MKQIGLGSGFLGDLDHCICKGIERILVFRLGRFDHEGFVDDERERLCVRPITDIDGSVAFHTHRGCEGNDCMEFLRKAIDPWLYADEDLWMYLSEWSRYPVIREDERQEGTVTE